MVKHLTSRLAESQTIIDSGKKATKDEIDTLAKKYTKTFNPRLTSLVTDAPYRTLI